MLKSFPEFIIFFRKRILISNVFIIKTTIYNRFIFFIEFVYVFLYITIHIPGIFISNIRIFVLNKGKLDNTFENIFKKVFKKIDCFFLDFFYSWIRFADSIDFFLVGIIYSTVFV